MIRNKNHSTWQKVRKLFNDIHLWLGLTSGIIIFVVCLSGTIYTYNTEIREIASPHLHFIQAQNTKISVDKLVTALRQEYPGNITAISIPLDPNRSYAISMRPPNDKSRSGVTYYVNPYSGELLGSSASKTKTDEFMGYLFSLHRWLLLDKIEKPIFDSIENRKLGSYITGTATILFTLGLITGMIIWFPRKINRWKQGLKVKFSSNWKRINHDLHNSLGIYSLVFLLLMGITGPQWSFEWYRTGLRKAIGTHQESPKEGKQRPSQALEKAASDKPIPEEETLDFLAWESYLEAASSTVNYKGDYRISLPKSGNDPIQVSMYKTGFFAPAAADVISLNRTDARVIKAELFKDNAFNEKVSRSIKALHVGNIYGQFSKLIYFITCLIATTLPVTGTLIWINKMKKKKPSKKKALVTT